METKFKLIFETDKPDLEIPLFRKSLPRGFEVTAENDGLYISVNSNEPEDAKCQFLVDRELDRYFFLTCVKVKASMVRKQVFALHTAKWRTHGSLSEEIGPQKWSYELAIQLRLWSVAVDTSDVMLQTILFYQIIELAYPERKYFPKYNDATEPPNPLTECKLLRDLVAHSGEVTTKQLKKYCEYLNIPELMHDPTDFQHLAIFRSKVGLLEFEAKCAIEKLL